jgi:hypothetical protein
MERPQFSKLPLVVLSKIAVMRLQELGNVDGVDLAIPKVQWTPISPFVGEVLSARYICYPFHMPQDPHFF